MRVNFDVAHQTNGAIVRCWERQRHLGSAARVLMICDYVSACDREERALIWPSGYPLSVTAGPFRLAPFNPSDCFLRRDQRSEHTPRADYRCFGLHTRQTLMRKLEEYEEIALIGYPYDGDYIAVVDGMGDRARLLGGALCGLDGATLTHQAAALPRYYPQASHLVIATIKGDRLVAIRDY